MKNFYGLYKITAAAAVILIAVTNVCLLRFVDRDAGRPWRVEINRIAHEIENGGGSSLDLSKCDYVTDVQKSDGSVMFYNVDSDYSIREINGTYYRFDYSVDRKKNDGHLFLIVNIALFIMAAVIIAVLFFVQSRILHPFERLTNVPYELSRGNLTVPIKEEKSRFFGKFVWGVNMLRENIEKQRERELNLQRSKKTLLLSLSHDIKTPLSAIKLYAKALSKGLYQDTERQAEIAERINEKADEIEKFISQITKASGEEFLSFEMHMGEFYLSEMMNEVSSYYYEKLMMIRTEFLVGPYSDCLLNGDLDRAIEVLQNLMENAVKYGDGHWIRIDISEEEDCRLIAVANSGCTLCEEELPHVFGSFYRGSNAGGSSGSGLGLYICRELMHRMNGEIFAQIRDGNMVVTAVFGKS